MKFGLFSIPDTREYAAGKATARDDIAWELQVAQWADEYGMAEMYFAEHYTYGLEASPAPDLMIAAAAMLTKDLRLGAAAHLLPYHHPTNLAFRLMWLDHLTGGRYIAGVAPGSYPTDAQLFQTNGKNAEMMQEALEIILRIWTEEGPWRIDGEFWTVDMPGWSDRWQGPHLKPLQTPHPPIAVVGMQPSSPSLSLAGKRGFIPVSQQLASNVLVQHWETYSRNAIEAGHTPDRGQWRIARDWFVAETDEQARELVLNSGMGRFWRDHNIQNFKEFGLASLLTGGAVPDDELTVEWLVDNLWIVGSPDTVVEKIAAMHEEVGGFGTLLSFASDHSDDPEPYRRNIELMGRVVAPRIQSVLGAA